MEVMELIGINSYNMLIIMRKKVEISLTRHTGGNAAEASPKLG